MNEVKHNQHENKYKTLLCECEIFFKKNEALSFNGTIISITLPNSRLNQITTTVIQPFSIK